MQMEDGLASMGSFVDDNSIAFLGKPLLFSHLGHDYQHVTEDFFVGSLFGFCNSTKSLFEFGCWNYEEMDEGLGVHVHDSHAFVVFM